MAPDIWGDLLRGARARHAFVSKTIVVLGEPSSGKSILVRQLVGSDQARASGPKETSGPLGFGFIELSENDKTDESLRTSVYTVHSFGSSIAATLPYAFPPVQTAPDASAMGALHRMRESIFLIILDWSKPWTFAAQLVAWFRLLRELIQQAYVAGQEHSADTERATMRENLETHLFPNADDVRPPGMLTDNLGVHIALVCTKADCLDTAIKERRLSDSQIDSLQQFLRTVAMCYGAAIFSTTITRASSYDALRAHVRHTLYPDTSEANGTSTVEASTADTRHLLVPAGWDSWSKIEAIDESFSCRTWHDAWIHDITSSSPLDATPRIASMCAELVPPPPMDDANHQSSVEVPSEQTFLAQLQAHQPPDDSNITASSHGAWKTAQTTPARNAIGPSMHASTLDVPSIGRVLEEQTREVSLPSSPAPSSRSDDVRTPSITTPKQTEVLHSFFQSRTCLSHYDIYIYMYMCLRHANKSSIEEAIESRVHTRYSFCSDAPCATTQRGWEFVEYMYRIMIWRLVDSPCRHVCMLLSSRESVAPSARSDHALHRDLQRR